MVQTALLFLDLLTLPFLVFYLASVYRVCMFPLPISQFLVHEPPFPHKSAFEEDWDAPVRLILVKSFVSMMKDILAAPFLLFSVATWRNPFFRRAYLAKTLLTLQTINIASRSTESPKATAAASAQAPLSNPNPDLEISLADAAALSQASPLPAATPSSPAQGQNVSNTDQEIIKKT